MNILAKILCRILGHTTFISLNPITSRIEVQGECSRCGAIISYDEAYTMAMRALDEELAP